MAYPFGAFPRTPEAVFILPCRPTSAAGPGWLYEMKHDGFRIPARKKGGRVDVWSRYGTDFTGRFPNIAEAVRSLPAESVLIDGEAVASSRTDIRILPSCARR